MTSERGAANIREFNLAREQKNMELVQKELEIHRRRKLQFPKTSQLAAYIADRTDIHRTTLQRNAKYRSLLARYIGAQAGGAKFVHDETDDPNVLKAKLALAQVELGNLRRELRRFTAQLSRSSQPATSSKSGSCAEVDFGNLCMLLTLVLVRAETFALDTNARSLIDLAAKPSDRIVGGPERSSAFIAWASRNRSMPFVSSLRRLDEAEPGQH